MKKLFVASALVFGLFTASAQTKIGYINSQEMLYSMPEIEKVQKEIEELRTALDQQLQEMQAAAEEKAAKFVKDSGTFTATMREIKREEVIKMYQEVEMFKQRTAQEKIQEQADAKVGPLRKKLQDAIKKVAADGGYLYILEESVVLVGPPANSIAPLVRKALGIPEPKAPVAPAPGIK